MSAPDRPTGAVTFLFSDIEGSTKAWDTAPAAMSSVLARHDDLVRNAIERNSGYVFATGGDGFAVAFTRAADAVAAAVDAQRAVRTEAWPSGLPIRVRMAINTGEVDERDGDYFGAAVNRTARLMSTAHGGQVVVSRRTADLASVLPAGSVFEDRGVHKLKDLQQPEFVQELVIDEQSVGSLRTAPVRNDQLPVFRTSFVGRHNELADLDREVANHRLVTIVGPGGSGKTRLAVEHAAAASTTLGDGAWFVDLTPATGGDLTNVVLTSLGLPAVGDWGPLRGWEATLVLDNCEHVLDSAADLAEQLLDACPGFRLVATSREALALPGELVLAVGSLGATATASIASEAGIGSGSEAVRLFLDRARLADRGFAPTEEDLVAIEDLCVELDGLPLAIELAAARVDRYRIAELAASLFDGGADRRDRRRIERHRGLDATIGWSADLMDAGTRAVLRRLSVFDGGFTADAATVVTAGEGVEAGSVQSELAALVDQSMVQATRTTRGTRYGLLATIRAFAARELDASGERDRVRGRHVDWVLDWSRGQTLDLSNPGWFSDVTEISNQRTALRYATDSGDISTAVDLFAECVGCLLSAGLLDDATEILAKLSGLTEEGNSVDHDKLAMCAMGLAELNGDFLRAHTLAEQFRHDDREQRHWYVASAFIAHHFAATDPRQASIVLDEFEGRSGVVPMSSYLRAEVALGEARFADAAEAIFSAFGTDNVSGLARAVARTHSADPIILVDLAIALRVLGLEESEVIVDVLAEETLPYFSAYVPLVRAVAGCGLSPLETTIADMREAQALLRRYAPPLVDRDCVVSGAFVAAELDRPGLAAEALAITQGMPQRTLSAFGLRKHLRPRLKAELGEEVWQAAVEAGAGRTPAETLDWLIGQLAP